MNSTTRPRVLQIYIDEPGGGRANVALLKGGLGAYVDWHELCLEVESTHGPSLFGNKLRNHIRTAVKEANPDIVHSHGTRAAFAVALANIAPASIVTLHGVHAVRRAGRFQRPLAVLLERRILSRMNVVLCTGRSDARLVRQLGLKNQVDVRWIHSTFTPPAVRDRAESRCNFDLPAWGKVILWMGRFEAEKQPLLFLEAFDAMPRRSGVVALMAGDGSLYQIAQEFVRQKGLSGVVRLPGWCEDTASAYAAADVFVSTSLWEGFPLTGLEAASAGLTLLLTEVPGNVDLVEVGLEAMLVRSGDVRAVAAGLEQVLDMPGAPPERTKEVLKDFSAQVQREEVMGAYRDVLARRSP